MYRKFFILTILLGFFLAPQAIAQNMKMNLNAVYPASNFHTQGAAQFGELVEQYTDGEIKITVHSGGSLGFKGEELLKAVGDASVPMSDILMGVVSGSEEIFGLSTYPRIVTSYEEARELYEAALPYYQEACRRWNQKLLYAAPWPPSGLFTKDRVDSIEDIDGLKTRTYDKNGAKFLRKAGGSPQSMPWGEVYSALNTGLIDSVLTSATSGKDGKFWEVLDHFTKINFAYPLNMVTINLDYWNSMSEDQQEAMLRAARETEKAQWEASRQSNRDSLKAIEENGIRITEVNEDFGEQLDRISEEIFKEFKAEAGEETKKALESIGM
ncbi:TRAP-type C4-dicarboxylate transport system substrate-binding protein [Desulfosalsimonas propionicica]|uniref:TRAP-type C4-dicarboxylate transport system substrate-binding protein n=1 Tax=Desulfosalsimonas propionicica TaxID=332175 RepID=A0A7W0CA71_9BACT|nr:TRAP transporter substrate-binding protein [Desulfosalsimonas propionicica]MBA2882011.1 TRAP-type C4-dicarboxylate transport system substrate-binding protein [Desulfosalsimonas propionicica]